MWKNFLTKVLFTLLFSLVFLFLSCEKNPAVSKINENDKLFQGITETNLEGDIISVDENDWGKSDTINADYFVPCYEIFPPYPNPTYNIPVILYFTLPLESNVDLLIINEDFDTLKTLINKSCNAGYYKVLWQLNDDNENRLSPGIYRCVFKANDFIKGGNILIKDYTAIKDTLYRSYADSLWIKEKWEFWYEIFGFGNDYINWYINNPIIKDEKFYELIGKYSPLIVGWKDVENYLVSFEETFNLYSPIRENYIILWGIAHE